MRGFNLSVFVAFIFIYYEIVGHGMTDDQGKPSDLSMEDNKIKRPLMDVLNQYAPIVSVFVSIVLGLLAFNLQNSSVELKKTSTKIADLSTKISIADQKNQFWKEIENLSSELASLNSDYAASIFMINAEAARFIIKYDNSLSVSDNQLNTGPEYASFVGKFYEAQGYLQKIVLKQKIASASLKYYASTLGVKNWDKFVFSVRETEDWQNNHLNKITQEIQWINDLYSGKSTMSATHVIVDGDSYEIMSYVYEKGHAMSSAVVDDQGPPALLRLYEFIDENMGLVQQKGQ